MRGIGHGAMTITRHHILMLPVICEVLIMGMAITAMYLGAVMACMEVVCIRCQAGRCQAGRISHIMA